MVVCNILALCVRNPLVTATGFHGYDTASFLSDVTFRYLTIQRYKVI